MYLVSAAASALHVAATDSVVCLLGRSSDCLSQDVTAWLNSAVMRLDARLSASGGGRMGIGEWLGQIESS